MAGRTARFAGPTQDFLTTLPHELLGNIIGLLCPYEISLATSPSARQYLLHTPYRRALADFAKVCLVSRQLRRVAQPLLFRAISYSRNVPDYDEETNPFTPNLVLRSLTERPDLGRHVRYLEFTEHRRLAAIVDDTTDDDAPLAEQPQEAATQQAQTQTEEGEDATHLAISILEHCKLIQTLVLCVPDLALIDPRDTGLKLNNLRTMILGQAAGIDYFRDDKVFEMAPSLRELFCLHERRRRMAPSAVEMALDHFQTLRRLSIEGISFPQMRLIMTECTSIEDVEYYKTIGQGTTNVTSLVNVFLPAKDRLKRLMIAHIPYYLPRRVVDGQHIPGNAVGYDPVPRVADWRRQRIINKSELARLKEFRNLRALGIDWLTHKGGYDSRFEVADPLSDMMPQNLETLRIFDGMYSMKTEFDQLAKEIPDRFKQLKKIFLGSMLRSEKDPREDHNPDFPIGLWDGIESLKELVEVEYIRDTNPLRLMPRQDLLY
ncbi:hypothetical protein B0I35DRAFT_489993 [Stachybotrys elegans]|uniref:F-box domain-containing protein n=1 Tax=Stachybotrys elegans TaxID=80388 RepID=A0A8K0SNE2_9HYPO|nr:hypothetical protein B0I35DRAFT_489993 [Stachybotrys elegans]